MKSGTVILVPALILSIPIASAQLATGSAPQQDEFPALQFLPEGSEVNGITIPRYEKHKATSLLKAEKMKVLSRSSVELDGIKAYLYGDNGLSTRIHSLKATYDFKTSTARANARTEVHDPRFSATGSAAIYSTKTGCGILRGPVHTTVSTESLTPATEKP